jgi:excisionase family DNA binding protein
MKRLTYTVPDVAALLGISRGAAYQAARNGQLPTIRIGKRLLVPIAALKKILGESLLHESGDSQIAEDSY